MDELPQVGTQATCSCPSPPQPDLVQWETKVTWLITLAAATLPGIGLPLLLDATDLVSLAWNSAPCSIVHLYMMCSIRFGSPRELARNTGSFACSRIGNFLSLTRPSPRNALASLLGCPHSHPTVGSGRSRRMLATKVFTRFCPGAPFPSQR